MVCLPSLVGLADRGPAAPPAVAPRPPSQPICVQNTLVPAVACRDGRCCEADDLAALYLIQQIVVPIQPTVATRSSLMFFRPTYRTPSAIIMALTGRSRPRSSDGWEQSERSRESSPGPLGAWPPGGASAPRTHLTLVYNLADMIKWQVDGLQVVCLTVTQFLLLGKENSAARLRRRALRRFVRDPFCFAPLFVRETRSDHQSITMGPTRWHLRPLRPRS